MSSMEQSWVNTPGNGHTFTCSSYSYFFTVMNVIIVCPDGFDNSYTSAKRSTHTLRSIRRIFISFSILQYFCVCGENTIIKCQISLREKLYLLRRIRGEKLKGFACKSAKNPFPTLRGTNISIFQGNLSDMWHKLNVLFLFFQENDHYNNNWVLPTGASVLVRKPKGKICQAGRG